MKGHPIERIIQLVVFNGGGQASAACRTRCGRDFGVKKKGHWGLCVEKDTKDVGCSQFLPMARDRPSFSDDFEMQRFNCGSFSRRWQWKCSALHSPPRHHHHLLLLRTNEPTDRRTDGPTESLAVLLFTLSGSQFKVYIAHPLNDKESKGRNEASK